MKNQAALKRRAKQRSVKYELGINISKHNKVLTGNGKHQLWKSTPPQCPTVHSGKICYLSHSTVGRHLSTAEESLLRKNWNSVSGRTPKHCTPKAKDFHDLYLRWDSFQETPHGTITGVLANFQSKTTSWTYLLRMYTPSHLPVELKFDIYPNSHIFICKKLILKSHWNVLNR